MQDKSKALQAALRANSVCSCITLDRDMLEATLNSQTGREGFGEQLAISHPHLFANSPVFIAPETMTVMTRVVTAVETAAALAQYGEAVRKWAPSGSAPDLGPAGALMGYDFHLSESGPVLIEINTNAGGAFLNAALARAQRACCFGSDGSNGSVEDFGPAIARMFRSEWLRQGRTGTPETIAIVDDAPLDQHLYPEFLLAKAALERQGISAVIADPTALEASGGKLLADGCKIDLVYNRLVDFTLDEPDHSVLKSAYLNNLAVVTPNPYVHTMLADKRNLSLLSDSALLTHWGLPKEQAEVLGTTIPATTLVTPDNAASLWAERRHLFFKPAQGYGSKAAYRGAKLTRSVWSQIRDGDYIAQQYAPPSLRKVKYDGEAVDLKVDVRLYTYAGSVLLKAARLYRGQTTNMRTPGGGFAPVLEV